MSVLKRSIIVRLSLSLLASASAIAKSEQPCLELPAPATCFCQPTDLSGSKPNVFSYKFYGTLKGADTFYGKNFSLLNSNNCDDEVFKVVNKFDIGVDFSCKEWLTGAAAARTKAIWGTNLASPTTTTSTKILNSVGQRHKHSIPRHFMWLREGWLEISLNQTFGLDSLVRQHYFTFGSFSFKLGRGIALGDAYAVSPDYLGFYSDNAVDQYAFAVKLSGEFIPETLTYDLYVALLDNLSDNLGKTAQNVFGQEYGRLDKPQRGFGHINRLIAGRLIWTPLDRNDAKATVEPYFLVNTDPEQNVEFLADAKSKLGTLGLAGEFANKQFEFGFDTAFNLGKQTVRGWDRNTVTLQNRNGQAQEVNTHVYVNADPTNDTNVTNWSAYQAPYVSNGITSAGVISTAGSEAQGLINDAIRDDANNGKSIGIATGFGDVALVPANTPNAQDNELFNATDRFRNKYCNKYCGWMMVADAAYFIKNGDVRLAATAGYASGDLDPNIDLKDCNYQGFIGLQELYAGKRVKSAFFLGGAGNLRRPLDVPTTSEQPDRFGALTSGFTNLGFLGMGAQWKPQTWERKFEINPNVLGYWQTFPTRSYDLKTKQVLDRPAHSYLGTEVNVYLKKEIFCDLDLFGITSLFIPGRHYDDVKGKPLNRAQQRILDRIDKTGFNEEQVPGLGNDISFTINIGFEYKF